MSLEIFEEEQLQALKIRIKDNVPIEYCPLYKIENLPSKICKHCYPKHCI